jgi:hypothetical protein
MSISSFGLGTTLLLGPRLVFAQQPNVPVVDLPEPTVRTAERLGAVLGLRQTADGKVLVNDALRRQMLLFDTTLANRIVVMDSVAGTSTTYGPRPTALIPFAGDSSLFADWKSSTVVVLDGHGRVTRTIALPRPQDIVALNGASSGFDAKGRLVFQGGRPSAPQSPGGTPGSGMDVLDSLPILRADLDARRVDTVAKIARPVMKVTTRATSAGTVATVFALDPLQPVDDWAILSTGAVAIVRGHDYHIDWIDPDGSTRSTDKTPFEWKRLTDADKQRLGDSLRTAQDSLLARGYPNAESSVMGPMPCRPPGEGRGGGPPDGGAARGGRGGGGGGAPPPPPGNGCYERLKSMPAPVGPPMWVLPPMPPVADISRAQPISDYAPPIRMNATMADLDGNLWILPRASTLSRRGELVYDVVNSNGALVQRVRLPVGRAVAGFAKGGVVYLTAGDFTNGYSIERTRLPRSRQ